MMYVDTNTYAHAKVSVLYIYVNYHVIFLQFGHSGYKVLEPKMDKPLLILLRVAYSNQPHMDKIRFMVLMVDDHIRMSIPNINDEDYFPPVPELEYDEYEEGLGDNYPHEYLSDDKDVSNTEDGIPSQDKNQLGGKILDVWERYKPLLEHDYSRKRHMMYVDTNTYAHAKVSVLYIYVNYHVIFLQLIII